MSTQDLVEQTKLSIVVADDHSQNVNAPTNHSTAKITTELDCKHDVYQYKLEKFRLFALIAVLIDLVIFTFMFDTFYTINYDLDKIEYSGSTPNTGINTSLLILLPLFCLCFSVGLLYITITKIDANLRHYIYLFVLLLHSGFIICENILLHHVSTRYIGNIIGSNDSIVNVKGTGAASLIMRNIEIVTIILAVKSVVVFIITVYFYMVDIWNKCKDNYYYYGEKMKIKVICIDIVQFIMLVGVFIVLVNSNGFEMSLVYLGHYASFSSVFLYHSNVLTSITPSDFSSQVDCCTYCIKCCNVCCEICEVCCKICEVCGCDDWCDDCCDCGA